MNHLPLFLSALAGFAIGTAIWLPLLLHAARTLRRVIDRAAHDPHTGLAHRGTARAHYRTRTAAGHPSTLILIDLDGFKQVNDHLGHLAGDQLIEHTARILAQYAQMWGGMAARLGGDEFVLILDVLDRCEHVRQIGQLHAQLGQPVTIDAHHGPITTGVTASAGVAIGDGPLAQASWETLIRAADLALYHAKQSRRPHVIHHPGLPVPVYVTGERLRDLPADGGLS